MHRWSETRCRLQPHRVSFVVAVSKALSVRLFCRATTGSVRTIYGQMGECQQTPIDANVYKTASYEDRHGRRQTGFHHFHGDDRGSTLRDANKNKGLAETLALFSAYGPRTDIRRRTNFAPRNLAVVTPQTGVIQGRPGLRIADPRVGFGLLVVGITRFTLNRVFLAFRPGRQCPIWSSMSTSHSRAARTSLCTCAAPSPQSAGPAHD